VSIFDRFRRRTAYLPTGAAGGGLPRMVAADSPGVDKALTRAHSAWRGPFLGLGACDRPVYAPDDRHLLVSDGAGGGRSALLRAIGAQAHAAGHRVVVIDITQRAHKWARDLPGAEYVTTVDDITRVLTALGDELAGVAGNDDAHTMPVTVLIEELALTTLRLDAAWREAGGGRRSTATVALDDILCYGRAVGMWVVGTGHMVTARTVPPDVRTSFLHLVGHRATAVTWRMLNAPMPERRNIPGRYHVVDAGQVTPFQALYLTDDEAREVAGVEVTY
jgi:hypothetical protein